MTSIIWKRWRITARTAKSHKHFLGCSGAVDINLDSKNLGYSKTLSPIILELKTQPFSRPAHQSINNQWICLFLKQFFRLFIMTADFLVIFTTTNLLTSNTSKYGDERLQPTACHAAISHLLNTGQLLGAGTLDMNDSLSVSKDTLCTKAMFSFERNSVALKNFKTCPVIVIFFYQCPIKQQRITLSHLPQKWKMHTISVNPISLYFIHLLILCSWQEF